MHERFEAALAALAAAGDNRAAAVNTESSLEDDRALVKKLATIRIMETHKLPATSAEKIVETDEEYAAHRAKQRTAVVTVQQADVAYYAAKARASREALLVPSLLELEAKNVEQAKLIKQQKEIIRSGDVACRRSNQMLAGRIQDVEQWQKRFREAERALEAAGLPVPPMPTIPTIVF